MKHEQVREKREPKKVQAVKLKEKALEPKVRFCHILKKRVLTLTEYFDYKSRFNKGTPGTIYCENIIDCYQNNIKCRYSGISPLYSDPFLPELSEEEIDQILKEKAEQPPSDS